MADHYLVGAETRVAEWQGVRLGFIGHRDDFIGGLFVAPAAQGQGMGRACAEHALAQKGRLMPEVHAANPAARGFHGRLGFVETGGREIDDLGNPGELIRLERVGSDGAGVAGEMSADAPPAAGGRPR